MTNNILVVAAHADDEVLGCGGAIARHAAEGDVVHAVFLADGIGARPGASPDDLERRMAAAEQAREILGLRSASFLDFPDNRMDTVPLLDVVQALEPFFRDLAPRTVYTHHHGDLNVDHRVTHQAVMTACRPLPESPVREIYAFEILSSTEWSLSPQEAFVPNVFVDISPYLDLKCKALEAYDFELRPTPHARSLEHARLLALHRGYSVGVTAAEAFVALRLIK